MYSNIMIGFSDADAAALATIVAEVENTQARIAAAQAEQTRALARAGELARAQAHHQLQRVRDHDMALRAIAAEVAGALHLTDRSVQRQIGDATELVQDYPATLDSWQAGMITRGHVRVITETGCVLPPEHRGDFEAEALRRCAHETPGRVRGELELLAERLHPRTLAERHREAREQRCVRVIPQHNGISHLNVPMPTVLADAIFDRLTQQARVIIDARAQAAMALRELQNPAHDCTVTDADGIAGSDQNTDRFSAIATDARTIDQIRCDVLADMLLTAAPDADPTRNDDGPGTLGSIRARVQIVVPALILLGSDEDPADLVGRSPIDPDTARELAGATRTPWERVLTHPVSGAVLHVDTYHRTAAIDRFLRARDQHCRFPGCRLAAVRCEVDHTHDHALGGATNVNNLAHLCQRHHSMKQFTAWKVRQLSGGILEWTSPLGRCYVDEPPSLGVHFRPPPQADTPHARDNCASSGPPEDTYPPDPPPF